MDHDRIFANLLRRTSSSIPNSQVTKKESTVSESYSGTISQDSSDYDSDFDTDGCTIVSEDLPRKPKLKRFMNWHDLLALSDSIPIDSKLIDQKPVNIDLLNCSSSSTSCYDGRSSASSRSKDAHQSLSHVTPSSTYTVENKRRKPLAYHDSVTARALDEPNSSDISHSNNDSSSLQSDITENGTKKDNAEFLNRLKDLADNSSCSSPTTKGSEKSSKHTTHRSVNRVVTYTLDEIVSPSVENNLELSESGTSQSDDHEPSYYISEVDSELTSRSKRIKALQGMLSIDASDTLESKLASTTSNYSKSSTDDRDRVNIDASSVDNPTAKSGKEEPVQEQQDSDVEYDTAIYIAGAKFRTNRYKLSIASGYFFSKFRRLPKDDTTNEFALNRDTGDDFDSEALQTVFDFVHGKEVVLGKHNLYEVLSASEYLDVIQLRDICADNLRRAIKTGPKSKQEKRAVPQNKYRKSSKKKTPFWSSLVPEWFMKKKPVQQSHASDRNKKPSLNFFTVLKSRLLT